MVADGVAQSSVVMTCQSNQFLIKTPLPSATGSPAPSALAGFFFFFIRLTFIVFDFCNLKFLFPL